jgi:hypothetical protein
MNLMGPTENKPSSGSDTRRTSFWTRTFEVARRSGDWVMVQRLYTQSTAAQLASDIVNAHNRNPNTIRVRGMHPGERWEARWEAAVEGPPGDYVVWVRTAPPAR